MSGGRGNLQLGSKRKKDNDHDHINNGHGKDETDKVMNTEHNVVDNVSNNSKKERNPDPNINGNQTHDFIGIETGERRNECVINEFGSVDLGHNMEAEDVRYVNTDLNTKVNMYERPNKRQKVTIYDWLNTAKVRKNINNGSAAVVRDISMEIIINKVHFAPDQKGSITQSAKQTELDTVNSLTSAENKTANMDQCQDSMRDDPS